MQHKPQRVTANDPDELLGRALTGMATTAPNRGGYRYPYRTHEEYVPLQDDRWGS